MRGAITGKLIHPIAPYCPVPCRLSSPACIPSADAPLGGERPKLGVRQTFGLIAQQQVIAVSHRQGRRPPGACEAENDTTGLTDYLTKDLGVLENKLNEDGEFTTNFQFAVQRKKRSGQFTVNWRQPSEPDSGRGIRVQLSSDNVESVDDPIRPDSTTFTFQPSDGGEVSVRRSAEDGEPVNSRDLLTCPYLGPNLVIILDRSPGG